MEPFTVRLELIGRRASLRARPQRTSAQVTSDRNVASPCDTGRVGRPRIGEITGGRGVDVVFDPVGGDTAARALRGIARNGRIVLIGLASGKPVALDAMDMLLRNYTAVGVLATPGDAAAEAAAWQRLTELAQQGAIATPVGRTYRFEEVPRMIADQAAPGAGKSVLLVGPGQ